MTIDEMIAVMQHYRDGGEVEYKRNLDAQWLAMRHEVWNFSEYDYRIKEKPKTNTRTVYEYMYKTSRGTLIIGQALHTEEEAKTLYQDSFYQKTGRRWELPND